jgi:hypothetical protein
MRPAKFIPVRRAGENPTGVAIFAAICMKVPITLSAEPIRAGREESENMRSLNTTRRPIVSGGDTITAGSALPRIDLERMYPSCEVKGASVIAFSSARAANLENKAENETVTLIDGTQITFRTIDLLASLETA